MPEHGAAKHGAADDGAADDGRPVTSTGAGPLAGTAGLTSAEAARRLEDTGPNRLPEARAVPGWRRL
ncbi:MAG TPA: cation-transporting P-type ATPase, partial [Arthrobacter sp.]|nr:cation-transporting P-type ATPase [Arthrobacter sp.]